MSTDNNDSSDEPTKRQRVADPEEFNQQRRLRSIHDARDRCRAIYEATQDPQTQESEQTLAAMYRAAVQNYIGELKGQLENYDWSDEDHNYWTEYHLGVLEIPPPQELAHAHQRKDITPIGDPDLDPKTYDIEGLRGFLDIAKYCPVREDFELPVKKRHEGQTSISGTVSMEMPVTISYDAYQVTNTFFTMIGFDVEIESSDHRAVIDDDVIEGVEGWRNRKLD